MTHSSRKSRRRSHSHSHDKRVAVTDEHGWTHITTGKNSRKALWMAVAGEARFNTKYKNHEGQDLAGTSDGTTLFPLHPAEAPRKLTLNELNLQFEKHRLKWEESPTWLALKAVLWQRRDVAKHSRSRLRSRQGSEIEKGTASESEVSTGTDSAATNDGDKDSELASVDDQSELQEMNIVCIGLGSPSGLLRGGWVDRRVVSLYQLAALVSVVEFFDCIMSQLGDQNLLHSSSRRQRRLRAFAQDPVFNSLDKALLSSLGITVVDHPAAFSLVHDQTLLFCPGAEKTHLERLVAFRPALLFGGPLEQADTPILDSFLAKRDSLLLPPFEPFEHAFWNMRLYWKKDEGVELI